MRVNKRRRRRASDACATAIAARAAVVWRRKAQSLQTPPRKLFGVAASGFPESAEGWLCVSACGGCGVAARKFWSPFFAARWLCQPAFLRAAPREASSATRPSGRRLDVALVCWGTTAARRSSVRVQRLIDLAPVRCRFVRSNRRSFSWWLWCGVAQMCQTSRHRMARSSSRDGYVFAALPSGQMRCLFTPLLALLRGLCCLGWGDRCNGVFEVASGFLMCMLHCFSGFFRVCFPVPFVLTPVFVWRLKAIVDLFQGF